jgi:hypothetical protein
MRQFSLKKQVQYCLLLQIAVLLDENICMIYADCHSSLLTVLKPPKNIYLIDTGSWNLWKAVLLSVRSHIHVCIYGKTVVDQEAKAALENPISLSPIPYTDFKPFVMKYILRCWQDSWIQQFNNKLHQYCSLFLWPLSQRIGGLDQMSHWSQYI